MPRLSPRRGAFTLIELLVVISIIALLVAILLPSLGAARRSARTVGCQSNIRNIGIAFVAYSVDHKDRLPATGKRFNANADMIGPQPDDRSWIGREAWPGVNHDGVLLDYLGSKGAPIAVAGEQGSIPIYRCPELQSGGGSNGSVSNGRFDYMGVYMFTGASASRVPQACEVKQPGTNWANGATQAFVPIVLEEDTLYYGGRQGTDPGHANADRIATYHPGLTSNYFTIDGSMQTYTGAEDGNGSVAKSDWRIKGPSGATYSFDYRDRLTGSVWGSWDRR